MPRRRWAQRPRLAKTRMAYKPAVVSEPVDRASHIKPLSPAVIKLAVPQASAILDAATLSIIGLSPPCIPTFETARRVRRGRPPPPLVWVLCRPLVQTNHIIFAWELCDEEILFRVLDASERAAERVAGAFAVLDEHARSFLALRVVIIFRIGDGPERLVRRRDRDRAF